MKKKPKLILFLITFGFILATSTAIAAQIITSFDNTAMNYKFQNLKTNALDYSNATIISDGYLGDYWNDGASSFPVMAVDNSGVIHAAWHDNTFGVWGVDSEIMYANYTETAGWSNITVISDGYLGVYWNTGNSYTPDIAVDDSGKVHVVWWDYTNGPWGGDEEIMYNSYTEATGWSNVTIISDGYSGVYWNDAGSYYPVIAVENTGTVHVVWHDYTIGAWGSDAEIMYVNYTEATGWSNVTVISDGYSGVYWNDGGSYYADIAVNDSGVVHVVWEDDTDGVWGTDSEIMYTSYTEATGWSNATIISDGYSGVFWNDGGSSFPDINVDNSGTIHLVWWDTTDGVWGTDIEIMYASYTVAIGWSNVTIISDGYMDIYWNDDGSFYPDIALDSLGAVHVVWFDFTDGAWGTDAEIMYVNYTEATGWSNVTIVSDGYNNVYWNDGDSSFGQGVCYNDKFYIVWDDTTDGVWGNDKEIMFTSVSIPAPLDSVKEIPGYNIFIVIFAVYAVTYLFIRKKQKKIK